MPHTHILTDVSDGIGTLTLNRPERLNAYTTEMGEEVTEVLRGWRDYAAVRAVIVTGAGRGFCAGVDLEHLKAHQAGTNVSKGPRLGEEDFLRKLPLELLAYPKPLIAARRCISCSQSAVSPHIACFSCLIASGFAAAMNSRSFPRASSMSFTSSNTRA